MAKATDEESVRFPVENKDDISKVEPNEYETVSDFSIK